MNLIIRGANMITTSIVIEQETLNRIKELQQEKGVFSRSEMIRRLIDIGLKEIGKEG